MILALSLMCLFSILTGFTNEVMFLALSLSIIVMGNNLFHPAGFSLSSKVMSPERRTTALGFFNAGGIMGFAIGPLSVGVLLGYLEWRQIYFVWALILLINLLFLITLKIMKAWNPPSINQEQDVIQPSIRSVFTLPVVALLLIIGLGWFGRHMILTYYTSFLVFDRTFTIQVSSILLGLISVAGIVGGPLGGFLADKHGIIKWFMVCTIGLIICTYLMVASNLMLPLVVVSLVFGFFAAGEMATGSSLVSRYIHFKRRGFGYSLYFLAIGGVSVVTPLVGAFIAERSSFFFVLLIAPFFMVMALIIMWTVLKKKFDVPTSYITS
jgi:MFS family permease